MHEGLIRAQSLLEGLKLSRLENCTVSNRDRQPGQTIENPNVVCSHLCGMQITALVQLLLKQNECQLSMFRKLTHIPEEHKSCLFLCIKKQVCFLRIPLWGCNKSPAVYNWPAVFSWVNSSLRRIRRCEAPCVSNCQIGSTGVRHDSALTATLAGWPLTSHC